MFVCLHAFVDLYMQNVSAWDEAIASKCMHLLQEDTKGLNWQILLLKEGCQ